MGDSGCFRCVAGGPAHEALRLFLIPYGLKPLAKSKVEEFIFGNCNNELSDKNFMYPVFCKGTFCDVIDFARIKPHCPLLVSKGRMKSWDVSLDFGSEITHVKKFNHSLPFINHSPFFDIFDLPPPEQFDRSKVPKQFWLDPNAEANPARSELNRMQEAKDFDFFKKPGSIVNPFANKSGPPVVPPAFPVSRHKGEDGCGRGKSDGYDDSPSPASASRDLATSSRRTLVAETVPTPNLFKNLPIDQQIRTKIAHWEDLISAQDRAEKSRRERAQTEPVNKKRQTTLEQSFSSLPDLVPTPDPVDPSSLPPPCFGLNRSPKEFQDRVNETTSRESGGTGST